MVAADGGTTLHVDGCRGGGTSLDGAAGDTGRVTTQAGQRVGGVEHHGLTALGADGAGVAHLAARLGVERGGVQHHHALPLLFAARDLYADRLFTHVS